MSSFGNSNRRMTDAFVDPFPNEGALCHSVAAQCCACMEGIQQWSHSLCHLMRRKSPPISLPVCNKSCKDAPAGSLLGVAKPSLWCPFRAFLVCVQTEELLEERKSLEKTSMMKNEDVSLWRQEEDASPLCAPAMSEQPALASLLWPSSPILLWLWVFTAASSSSGCSVCLHASVCAGSWFLPVFPCAIALWKVVLCTWVTNIIWDRKFTRRDQPVWSSYFMLGSCRKSWQHRSLK